MDMDLDPNLQLRLRERPPGPSLMRHKWRDLTFLHYSVDPQVIQTLIPPELTVDTFGGRAWVGLVPFWMTGVRMSFLPAIPGTHTFPETNVRTYVHRDGNDPGVWFFSLDAANSLAVWGARKFFGLPYFRADMELEHNAGLRYESRRRGSSAGYNIQIQVGGVVPVPEPGTLEFFLVERYLLYSQHRGRIVTGMVHHEPYSLFHASKERCVETLLEANGLSAQAWEHVCYSPGVDVEVFAVRK